MGYRRLASSVQARSSCQVAESVRPVPGVVEYRTHLGGSTTGLTGDRCQVNNNHMSRPDGANRLNDLRPKASAQRPHPSTFLLTINRRKSSRTRTKIPTEPPQKNWRQQMEGVRSMRRSKDAAVDFAGAGALKDSSAGSDDDVRFQVSSRATSWRNL